jgi:uncharacterized membrane protein HdeD (DUF308 family)
MEIESNIKHLDSDVLKKNLGWFIALGIGLILLGIVSVATPLVATFAIANLVGVIFLVGGVMFTIHAFRSRRWGRGIAEFLISLLYIGSGVFILAYPLAGMFTLTLFLAAFFVVEGIFKIIQSLQMRQVSNWGWALLGGIVSLFLGIIIFAGMPLTALWTVGLIVGIDLIFGGISTVMVAVSMRHALQERRQFCIGNVCFQ